MDSGFVVPDKYILFELGELLKGNNLGGAYFTKTYNDVNIFLGTFSGQNEA